jgi:hypothetical protein
MKTPEEIEKLATAKYGRGIYSIDEVEAYKEGYTQCQKDDAGKKYTEEQLRILVASVTEFMSHNEPEEFDEWFEKKLEKILLINKQA